MYQSNIGEIVSGSGPGVPSAFIMDVGAHNGDDTAYYLHRGYRVVAVEASPDVPSVTMGDLLERHGVPNYLEIDIEGMDQECLQSLDKENLPRYISLELSHGDDIIGSLEKLGYTRFKVVNQMTYTTAVSIFPHEIGWRLLRKTRLGKLLPDGIKIDCDRVHTSHDWVFRQGCSGPFGEDTFGDWLTADRASQLYQRVRGVFVRAGRPLAHCWYDVHATL